MTNLAHWYSYNFPSKEAVLSHFFQDFHTHAQAFHVWLDPTDVHFFEKGNQPRVLDAKLKGKIYANWFYEPLACGGINVILNIKNMKTGESHTFTSWQFAKESYNPAHDHTPSRHQLEAQKQKQAEIAAGRQRLKAQKEAQEKKEMAGAVSSTQTFLKNRTTFASHTPYTRKKQLPDGQYRVLKTNPDILVVPVTNKYGETSSYQLINPQKDKTGRDKFFKRAGKTAFGHYKITGHQDFAVIVEGFADGWSVHLSLGCTVIVAFSAGQLSNISSLYPDAFIIADHDLKQIGQDKALQTGKPFWFPKYAGQDASDVYCGRGGAKALANGFGAFLKRYKKQEKLTENQLFQDIWKWLYGQQKKLVDNTDFVKESWVYELIKAFPVVAGNHIIIEKFKKKLNHLTDYRNQLALSVTRLEGRFKTKQLPYSAVPKLQVKDGVVYFIKAPMGYGKTQNLIKGYLNNVEKLRRSALVTSPRQSLSYNSADMLDIGLYSDIKKREQADYVFRNMMVCCIPSLDKDILKNFIDTCSILIWDECSMSRQMIPSEKTCNEEDYQKIIELLGHMRSGIFSDAFLTNEDIQFYARHLPKDVEIVVIDIEDADLGLEADVVVGNDALPALTSRARKLLNDKKSIWFSCESKDKSHLIGRALSPLVGKNDVLIVNEDTKFQPKVADFLRNPDEESRKYRIIAHSPTVSSGISVEHELALLSDPQQRFDECFLLAGGFTITPSEACQMMRRVRYNKRWTIGVPLNNFTYDIPKVSEEHTRKIMEHEYYRGLSSYETFCRDIRFERWNQRAFFGFLLIQLLKKMNFNYRIFYSAEELAEKDILDQISVELKNAQYEKLVSARDIEWWEADQIRSDVQADKAVQDDVIALQAHDLKKVCAFEGDNKDISKELYDFYDQGRIISKRNAARQFLGIHADPEPSDYVKARTKYQHQLFLGFNVAGNWNAQKAETIMKRADSTLRDKLTTFGVIAGKYGVYDPIEASDGTIELKPRYKLTTAYPMRFLKEVLDHNFGIKLQRPNHKYKSYQPEKNNLEMLNKAISLQPFDWSTSSGTLGDNSKEMTGHVPPIKNSSQQPVIDDFQRNNDPPDDVERIEVPILVFDSKNRLLDNENDACESSKKSIPPINENVIRNKKQSYQLFGVTYQPFHKMSVQDLQEVPNGTRGWWNGHIIELRSHDPSISPAISNDVLRNECEERISF